MAKYVYGIASVKYGTVCATGDSPTMPATGDMTAFAYTVAGSFTLSEDEATTKEFKVEELTAPVVELVTDSGAFAAKWRVYDMTPAHVEAFKGGVNGTTYYAGPENVATVEKAIEIISTDGTKIEIYRASCLARFDSVIGRENLLELEVSAKALAPETSGTDAGDKAPYRITPPV